MEGDGISKAISSVFDSNGVHSSVKESKKQESEEDYLETQEHPMVEQSGHHPRVMTLPETEAYEPWYWAIEYGYAWIAGYRPFIYWANTTNCFNRMSNMTFHEIPEFQKNLARPRFSVYE